MAKPVSTLNPKKQLDSFLAKFDPKIASLARRALTKMRQRLPGSIEMVYDNYNALAIGFVPDERPSNAIFSVVLYTRHINLFFLQGVGLPDPNRRLQGTGNQVRHIRLESIATLDDPAIVSLMNAALHRAKVPLDPKQPRKLIIKAISSKQRPRRI
ncbi:MAG: hypothetical protein ABSH39_03890 [Candidatus Acidiferrum sp.]|jgi:hypothetical protein